MSEAEKDYSGSNGISLKQFAELSVEDIAQLDFEQLFTVQDSITQMKLEAKSFDERINAAIMLKIGEDHAKERRRQSKDTGVVALLYPPYTVSVDVSKKVEWDQLKLREAATKIADMGADALDYLDYKINIAEEKYKKLPGNIKDIVDHARIVKTGKPSPMIKPPKEDE